MTVAASLDRESIVRAPAGQGGFLSKVAVIAALMLSDVAMFAAVDLLLRAFNADPEIILSYRKPIAANFVRFDLIVIITLAFIAMRCMFGDYTKRQHFLDGARTTTRALVVTCIPFFAALALTKPAHALVPGAIFWGSLFFLIPWGRQWMRWLLSLAGLWMVPTAIIGASKSAHDACAIFAQQVSLGFDVRWIVPEYPGMPVAEPLSHLQVVSRPFNDLVPVLSQLGCAQVIFVPDGSTHDPLNELIDQLIGANIGVAIVPSIRKFPLFGLSTNYLFGKDMLLLQARNNLGRLSQRMLKRMADVVGSIVLLILLSPLFLLLALAIKLDDGGPIFFSQPRLGRRCRDFTCLKFRTMVTDAEDQMANWERDNPVLLAKYRASNFKLPNDPRVTRVGAWLRRTSLDELPQLFNVVRGDMSLVGPRPLLARELGEYGAAIALYEHVRPGITGLWQINGRSETQFADRVSYDEWYIKNWTLWYDVVILLQTTRVLVEARGAY